MSKGNPDIGLDIYHALMSMLHAEKTTTQVRVDIMRIPLEQVVDGSVYQFELESECESCGGTGYTCSDKSCHHWKLGIDRVDYVCKEHCVSSTICACTDGKTTKRISHYDLTVNEIYSGYFALKTQPCIEPITLANDKGTMRAIKIREVV